MTPTRVQAGSERYAGIRQSMKERRDELKARAVALLGGKCIRCGFTPRRLIDNAAMEFHHRDPSTKRFQICSSFTRSWDVIVTELRKCDLLCSNCHRITEAELAVDRVNGGRLAAALQHARTLTTQRSNTR